MRSIAITMCLALTGLASANEFTEQIQAHVESDIKGWLQSSEVINAVKMQNTKSAGLSETDIIALDKQWRAETAAGSTPLIDEVLGNSLSSYLMSVADGSMGFYTEIFVMDNKGLNVGQSSITSDYWQGDEAKWQESFLTNSVHIGEIEEDESTQTFQSQVSVPVIDPDNNEPIGAVTVGINVGMF